MSNKIPRKFNMIKGEMLINTSMNKIGDIVHISKNEYGYVSHNTNTNKNAQCFLSMLRNANVIKILEII